MDLYERIFETVSEALLVTDGAGRIASVNAQTERMFGYTRQELLGQPTEILVPAELRARHVERLAAFLAAPRLRPMGTVTEIQGQRKDGTRFPIDVRLDPISVAEGICVLATVRDITERKRAEEAGQRHEERMRAVFDAGLIGMSVASPQRKFLEVNDALAEMLLVPKHALVGRSWEEFTHPDDLAENVHLLESTLAGERDSYRMEKRYIRADGSDLHVAIATRAVRNDDRSVRYLVTLVQDITERRQAEEKLRESQRFIEAVAAASPPLIYVFDMDTLRVTYKNRSVVHELGYPATATGEDELSQLRHFMPPDEAPHLDRLLSDWRDLRDGRVREDEYRLIAADGSIRCFLGRETVFGRHDDGSVHRILGTLYDITKRQRAEALVLEKQRRLRAISNNLPNCAIYQIVRHADGTMRFSHVGEQVERLTGLSVAEVLGDPSSLLALLHPDDRSAIVAALAASAEPLSAFDIVVRLALRDRRARWMRFTSAPRHLEDGCICWDGALTDVTQGYVANLQLRESEATLAALVDSASDAVVSVDPEGRISRFNPAAERIFGRPAASMIGETVDNLVPEAARAAHRRAIRSFAACAVRSRAMSVGRVQGVRSDGTLLELDSWISQVTVGEKHVLTAILRDVTERVHTERALIKYQLELTELTRQLMAQEKATSTRLAQILHDQLGQTLTAMRIDFVSEARLPDPRQAARHARVDRLIDEAVREVRQVLVELRPTLLNERGLIEALDNELRSRQAFAPDVILCLEVPGGLQGLRWNADVEYAAFMVAREAVANALLHSGASHVRVILTGGPRRLEMEIVDDGTGLAGDALAVRPGHLGIVGMRERSVAIGAQFEVRAAPEGGTSVRLAWNGEPA